VLWLVDEKTIFSPDRTADGYLEEIKCYFRWKSNRLARALRNRIHSLDERHAWRYTFFALPFREPVFLEPASTTPYKRKVNS
jgi:hypothetical protein